MATVLIVDDEVSYRAEIGRALAEDGHRIDEASSGNAALARLKETRYDLLVTDLMMEEGTGFEVLEWVRENAPGLPVVVCSSYAKADMLKPFLTLQPYRILRKPFHPDELLGHVRALLGRAE